MRRIGHILGHAPKPYGAVVAWAHTCSARRDYTDNTQHTYSQQPDDGAAALEPEPSPWRAWLPDATAESQDSWGSHDSDEACPGFQQDGGGSSGAIVTDTSSDSGNDTSAQLCAAPLRRQWTEHDTRFWITALWMILRACAGWRMGIPWLLRHRGKSEVLGKGTAAAKRNKAGSWRQSRDMLRALLW